MSTKGAVLRDRKFTESQLLEAIRSGKNDEHLGYLYDHTYPKIRAMVRKLGGNEDDARDAFQDAVMVFIKKVREGTYKHTTEIDAFIYRVARNIWINASKIKQRNTSMDTTEQDFDAGEDVQRYLELKEKSETIAALLNEVGERCKELLLNSVFNNLSMKEIAEKMGFANENAAKTKNYKCKKRLLAVMQNSTIIKELL